MRCAFQYCRADARFSKVVIRQSEDQEIRKQTLRPNLQVGHEKFVEIRIGRRQLGVPEFGSATTRAFVCMEDRQLFSRPDPIDRMQLGSPQPEGGGSALSADTTQCCMNFFRSTHESCDGMPPIIGEMGARLFPKAHLVRPEVRLGLGHDPKGDDAEQQTREQRELVYATGLCFRVQH